MRKFWKHERRGVAALEFVLVAPALFMVIFVGAELSILLARYMTLANAAVVGAKQFAFSAGVSATPYDDAMSAIQGSASTLNLSTSGITLSVNGTACTTNTACGDALQAGTGYVTVQLTYSCVDLNMFYNMLPVCSISSQQSERVQ